MATKLDLRQSELRAALPMVGSAANDTADTILPKIDAELAKLFEDRNILLTDGGLVTFTGTQVQFTENLNLVINQKISGAVPQIISLGSANQNFTSSGDMMIAVVNRTAGTAVVSIVTAGNPLSAVTSSNQEVFLIAKRQDAGDGTQRLYWRNGMALNAGQTVRLGASGSGSGGSGTGDDLDALQFRASFDDEFSEGPTASTSAVDATFAHTNATYNAAKGLYQLSYDAGKTGTSTGTAFTLSGTPAFTVAAGDVVANRVSGEVRKIASISSQTAYTLESAFSANLATVAVTVSQAVHSKDIYNLAIDGSAIAAAFGSATFSEILVDYEDNSTVNDGVFHPNVAPVIAYTASPDGTTYSLSTVRVTNDTDTFTTLVLPSAGTALYMRFFANKSSGSGTVNVLRYKVFVQKSVSSASGGVQNSALAFTNGVGTPVNCSVSLSGGKTLITLGFQYAVGVSPGSPYGSLDVFLNGQLIPRFINSTLTPDASYLETSSKILTLDKDYSNQNLSIEVLQRSQIVDASTSNTSAISAFNDTLSSGFQAFVNSSNLLSATTSVGAPAAGAFYSSIIGRLSIVDMSQDLRARMGIERLMIQQVYPIQNEFGPNGEPVWATPNDSFNQIRFVGSSWNTLFSTSGYRTRTTVAGEFIEVTFYGTGINLISDYANVSTGATFSVDGGSTASLGIVAATTTLQARNIAPNQPSTAAGLSGLTLGIHTVKFIFNGSSDIYGFEILNESSSLKVQPGISYVNGQKLVLAAQSVQAYNSSFESGTLGSRGGRVLVYQKSDGTVAKAVNPAGSQLNLTSADHSNEEMVRRHTFREFAASRTDDFSIALSASTVAFTLDDDTTTLTGNTVTLIAASGSIPESVQMPTTGTSSLTLTFVGTGLDIVQAGTGSFEGLAVTVDGVSIGSTAIYSVTKITKVVSGLPYGTHVVKFLRSVNSVSSPTIAAFLVYQPKKPSLPSGATELADYNIMATYVANATAGIDTIGTGLLRKQNTREFIYTGTWNAPSINVGFETGGWQVNTTTAASSASLTFFGTGFEERFSNSPGTGGAHSINVDGNLVSTANYSISLNGGAFSGTPTFGTVSITTYGTAVTFTPSTGILSYTGPNNGGSGLTLTGLTLGTHTAKIILTGARIDFDGFDIITPIHSIKSNLAADLQNTLMVGSNAISDNRKLTPVKDILPGTKSWAQSIGITSGPTTTSTSLVPMPEMSCTIKTAGGRLRVTFTGSLAINTSGTNTLLYQFYIDGVAVGVQLAAIEPNSNQAVNVSLSESFQVGAGIHKVELYWAVDGSTGQASGTRRVMLVEEL